MMHIRRSKDRGHADHGWLDSWHTFSFAEYRDPEFMGFHHIRVINQDRIAPGSGFGTHSHRDMEIISYVIDGALAHKDSMGNGSSITPGEVQYMSAGSGVTHSEFNHSKDQTTEFLQIWIPPNVKGAPPAYDQRMFAEASRLGRLCLVISGDGRDGSIRIRQNVDLYASLLKPGQTISQPVHQKSAVWLQLIRGGLIVNEKELSPGDGLGAFEITQLDIKARPMGNTGNDRAEFLLFVMPLK